MSLRKQSKTKYVDIDLLKEPMSCSTHISINRTFSFLHVRIKHLCLSRKHLALTYVTAAPIEKGLISGRLQQNCTRDASRARLDGAGHKSGTVD